MEGGATLGCLSVEKFTTLVTFLSDFSPHFTFEHSTTTSCSLTHSLTYVVATVEREFITTELPLIKLRAATSILATGIQVPKTRRGGQPKPPDSSLQLNLLLHLNQFIHFAKLHRPIDVHAIQSQVWIIVRPTIALDCGQLRVAEVHAAALLVVLVLVLVLV